MPSSTPGGMLTDSVFSRRTRPWPPQRRHGFSMTWPAPWQVGQVRSMVKKPCCARTLPCPWQVGQVIGREPASAPLPLHGSQCDEGRRRGSSSACPEGVFERDLEVVAQVAAAAGAALASRRPPPIAPNISSKMSAKPPEKPRNPPAKPKSPRRGRRSRKRRGRTGHRRRASARPSGRHRPR